MVITPRPSPTSVESAVSADQVPAAMEYVLNVQKAIKDAKMLLQK
jgi:hypothetical protein